MNTKHYLLMMAAAVNYFTASAQNKNDDKVRVKIYSNDNGKIVNIDTTFADEKSADAFLKHNNFDAPAPPVPPLPPLPGKAPVPPLPPDAPKQKRNSNNNARIEIYTDKEMREEMQELKKEMKKLQEKLSDEMEELKDLDFEFYDLDDENDNGKKQRIIIKRFENGMRDTLIELNFNDWDEMDKHMPCLDSVETGYKFFYKMDDDESGNIVVKPKHHAVIITKEKMDDANKGEQKKKIKKDAEKKSEAEGKSENRFKLNPQNFSLSPNPGDGNYNLRFTLEKSEPVIIRVIDINGTEVFSETIKNFKGTYDDQLNIQGRMPGSYVLQIRQSEKLFTQKFVLK